MKSGCLTSKACIFSKGAGEEKGIQVPLLGGWGSGRMGKRVTTTLGDTCYTPNILHAISYFSPHCNSKVVRISFWMKYFEAER